MQNIANKLVSNWDVCVCVWVGGGGSVAGTGGLCEQSLPSSSRGSSSSRVVSSTTEPHSQEAH